MRRSEGKPIRLMLVDDHEILRIGLRTLFSEAGGFDVVGETSTMVGAVTEAWRLKPDLVLMEVRLPDGSGIEACRTIRATQPRTAVLFLSSLANDQAVLATILAGAGGFVLKEVSGEQLVGAAKTVADGRSILDRGLTRQVLTNMHAMASRTGEGRHDFLSRQEQRVLALVAEGLTNKEIAVSLHLSDKTVGNYLSNIFQKLHVTRRTQAAMYYAHHLPNR